MEDRCNPKPNTSTFTQKTMLRMLSSRIGSFLSLKCMRQPRGYGSKIVFLKICMWVVVQEVMVLKYMGDG